MDPRPGPALLPLEDLPRIAWDVTAQAPLRSLQRPFVQRRHVVCTDAVIALEFPVAIFAPALLERLARRVKGSGLPDVDGPFARWEGDGRSWRLPGFDDGEPHARDRSRILLGGTPLLAYRIAFLLRHGVRHVYTGRRATDAVRFDLPGDVGEGLLLPALGMPVD